MSEAMTGRDYYIKQGYDELPDVVREEMRRVFDTGVNNSGVWVRFREVENLAGVMAYEYTNKPSAERNGKWIRKDDEQCYWYECSECGHCPPKDTFKQEWLSHFCPNCGARMEEKK